jgi:hypothetical protein
MKLKSGKVKEWKGGKWKVEQLKDEERRKAKNYPLISSPIF